MSIRSLIVFVVSTTVIASGLTITPMINPESQAPSQVAQAAVPGAVAAPAVAPADPPPPTYDEVVLADSPQLYYRLDETSGSFADSSGRGISGLALPGAGPWTANLGSALTNQPSNKAAKFSGYNVNSQTSVAAGLPTANSARSIEWWAKADTPGPFALGWGGFEVLQTASTIKVGATTFQLPVTALSNRWHHWVVSYDPAQSRLIEVFVDGKLAASGNAPANYATTDTTFKIRGTSLTSNPSVRFDEIAVYDTALDATTALEHFDASGATRPTAVDDLTATGGNGAVNADWDAATADTPDSEPAITGYRVSAISGGDVRATKWVPGSATSATLTGLGSGSYTVQVQAGNNFFGLGPAETSEAVTAEAGSAYAAAVQADNPLLYYRLGETSGTPYFADSSGRTTTGLEFPTGASIAPNADTALPTDVDTSSTFSGYNTSIATPNIVGLPFGNTARSTELWMRNNSGGGHFALGWGGYELTFNNAGTIAGPSFTATPPVNPLNGSWHHVVVTYEPTSKTFRIYIDGALTNTNTIGTALAGTDGQLVLRSTSLTKSPNVKLDELAVYDSQLSAAQVLEHYQASGRAAPVTPQNFDAVAGDGYLDASWDAVTAPQGQPATTGYRLHVMSGSTIVETKWAGPAATSATLSGLAAGDYTVVIQAANSNGFSSAGSTDTKTVTAGEGGGYASTVKADAPKLFYRLGEDSGSPQFADSSGRGVAGIDLPNNGALNPGINGGLHSDSDSAAGISGFDPSTVTVAPAGLPAANAARSVEWWMRGTTGPAAFSWGGFEVLAANNSVKFGATIVPVTRPLLDDNWHHVTVTYSPSESRLITVYVDGQVLGTANAAANVTGTDGTFKVRGANLSSASNVRLDEIAVYDTVLSQTRVQAHFGASGAAFPAVTSATASGGNGFVAVEWDADNGVAPDSQPGTNGFLITATKAGQPVVKRWTSGEATDATLGGLAPGEYTVTVEPANGFGRGTASTTDPVDVTAGDTEGYASKVRADSPKLYYRLGETAGSKALADSSGRATDAFDLFNTARLSPGANGALVADPDGSATVNGFDPTIQTLNAAGLPTGNSARSVEWWVRGTSGPWSFSWGDFTVGANAQSITVGPNALGYPQNLLDNNWHHVVATYDPSASRLIKIYIDGEVAASGNAASNLTGADGPFTIKGTNLSNTTNVRLDDVAIYDTTLTAQKVKDHFDASGATRPSAAGELQATGGIGTIELSWAQPAVGSAPDGQPGITGYRITATQGSTPMMSRWLPADADQATLTGLPAGDYTVAISGVNGFGFGTPAVSGTVTVATGGSSYLSTVRADGPVLYYRAGEPEGSPKLADSSGRETPLIDLPAVGGFATGANGALIPDVDTAVELTGSDPASATPADAGLPTGDTARSVEWWMRSPSGAFSARWGGSIIKAAGTSVTLHNNATTIATVTVPNLSDDQWHHVVLTYDPAGPRTVNVYVDGTLAGTATASVAVGGTAGAFQLGAAGQAFAGRVDELAVYPTALNLAQIQAHYVAARPESVSPPTQLRVIPRPKGAATLTWKAAVGVVGRVPDAYEIVRTKDGVDEQTKQIPGDLTRMEINALADGADYQFKVAAKYGDFSSEVAQSDVYTPELAPPTTPTASGASFAVGTAYKSHSVHSPTDDTNPCNSSPEVKWMGSGKCGQSYGSGLVSVTNTSTFTIYPTIYVDFNGTCSLTAGSSFPSGLAPGQSAVVGGYLFGFDTSQYCQGKQARIEVTLHGLGVYEFTDTYIAEGHPWLSRDWKQISGDGLFAGYAASGEASCDVLDPIEARTGAYREQHCLLVYPNRGVPLRFDISYNSQHNEQDATVGHGWTNGTDLTISRDQTLSKHGVLFRQEDGSTVHFTSSDGTTYETVPGIYLSLKRVDGGFEIVRRKQEVLTFDSEGRITKRRDLNNEGLTYNYDADSRLESVTGTSGSELTFEYVPGSRRIAAVTGPLGRAVELEYDEQGNLESWTDLTGALTLYEYNSAHLVTSVEGPDGALTQNTYDSNRRVSAQTDPMDVTSTLTYSGATTTVTSPGATGNAVTTYSFTNGLLANMTRAAGTGLAQTTHYEYHPVTRERTKMTRPDGKITTATYDYSGNQLSFTNELGKTTTFTYNALNNVTSRTSPTGVRSEATYDNRGNRLAVKVPKATGGWLTTTYAYGDPAHTGDVTTVTTPRGATITKEYDTIGHAVRVEDSTGAVRTATYNAAGQPLTSVGPKGHLAGANPVDHTMTYNYLSDGRPTGATDPTGATTTAVYGANSRVELTTDPDGTWKTYDYDEIGRLVATGINGDTVESSSLDAAGNRVARQDANGNSTTSTFDNLNRLTSTTDAEGRTETYEYDAGNRITSLTRPDSSVVSFTYDDADQLTAIDYPGTTADVTYAYDDDGRRVSMTDTTGTTTYRYNDAGLLDRVTSPSSQQVNYGFDAHGAQSTITYPSGRVVQREFDTNGRLASLDDGTAGDYEFTYDVEGVLTSVTYPNEVVTSVTRDNLANTTNAQTVSGSSVLFDATYSYGDDGLPSEVLESGNAELDQQFAYEDRGRLTESGPGGSVDWDVDQAGNLVTVRGENQTSDDADRPLTLDTSAGSATFGYDGRGNRTSATGPAGTTTYGYDTANRMTTGSDGSVYTFTGDNLRATAQPAGTGPVLDWVWDQTSDVPTLLTDGTREYVYGPGGIALSDQPIVGSTGSHPAVFLHSDGFGSIRSATDTNGDQVWARSYDAYGADAGTWTAPGYTGPVSKLAWNSQYRDDDGLYYLRARTYDPAAGGFTSQDPALEVSGEAYGYGNSSPTVFTDPMGTTAVSNGLTGLDDGSGNVAAADSATTYDPAFAFRDGLPKCSGWSKSLKLGIGVAALIPVGGGILKGAKGFVKACKRCVSVPMGPGGEKAWKVLNRVDEKGAPFPHYKGGKPYRNDGDGMRLPEVGPGGPIRYREWDLNPNAKGVGRDGERLVTGCDGSAYVTSDHYETFVRIR